MVIDRIKLDACVAAFRSQLGGFGKFTDTEGSYAAYERAYKDELMSVYKDLLEPLTAGGGADQDWFGQMLLLLKKPLKSFGPNRRQNFVPWQLIDTLGKAPESWQNAMGRALGKMLASPLLPDEAFGAFQADWQSASGLIENNTIEAGLKPTNGRLHALGGLLLALSRPEEAVFVRPGIWKSRGLALANEDLFPAGETFAQGYQRCLAFAQALFIELRRMGLEPKDLWDVQGFLWVLGKHEDTDAAEEPEMTGEQEMPPLHSLNLILHGPPGTGKTFQTAKIAVEMCGEVAPEDRDELMSSYRRLSDTGRIEFVTFHQSFAYEDFVEGLRPVQIEGSAGFELRPNDGILKRIAAKANAVSTVNAEPGFNVTGRQIFKMSLGRAFIEEDAYLYEDCIENNYVGLGYGGDIDFSSDDFSSNLAIRDRWRLENPNAVANDPNIQLIHALRNWMKDGDLVIISEGNSRFRAIGVVAGPYEFKADAAPFYRHRRNVKWLWQTDQSLPYDLIQKKRFSMVSLYNLANAGLNLEALSDLVAPKQLTVSGQLPHVLIIDEINRANVSKTFGELITLLEDDKRLGAQNEVKVRLPYSGETFGLPANLHVLGTMNTADRSIALLDTALRRRFAFQEIMPDPDVLVESVDGVPVKAILEGLNERIEWLYDRDHLVGHAWLMSARTDEELSICFQTKIIPLLKEYFHEDWDRVRAALGETDNTSFFVAKSPIRPPEGYGGAVDRYRYTIQEGPYGRAAWLQVAGDRL
ncbi:AAA family ATPase [Aquidulcibacter paucihalophilus]|uniref:AAA family ATPase n=1 Tax=Aquidulcibacter paucihalophilus TaxID=1978549 RepID=UPI000A19B05A|nr:AAA family ATPase [Aquidulcibacter paucihalophilus]